MGRIYFSRVSAVAREVELKQGDGPGVGQALIVEDRLATARALERLLAEQFPDVQVRTVGGVAEALACLKTWGPDLALIDLGLPDGSGVQIIEHLSANQPACFRVVTTIFADDVHLFPALRAGANGYLLKDQPAAQLGKALKGILNGEPPLSPAIARRLLQVFNPEPDETGVKLSPRERETLILIAKGCRLREVAEQLGVTRNTAAGYLKSVYRKLDVSSRAEATLEAVRRGLVGSSI